MATRKRTTHRSSRTKKRASASRQKGWMRAIFGGRSAFSRDVVGVFLLVTGLFFTAAFLPGRGASLGAALLLLAVATTLAADLSPDQRFDAAAYTDHGGLLGSSLYAALYAAVGTIGAVLTLCSLYVVGLSLLTGVTLRAAAEGIGDGAHSLYRSLSSWARELREKRERDRREREGRPSDGWAPEGTEQPVDVSAP